MFDHSTLQPLVLKWIVAQPGFTSSIPSRSSGSRFHKQAPGRWPVGTKKKWEEETSITQEMDAFSLDVSLGGHAESSFNLKNSMKVFKLFSMNLCRLYYFLGHLAPIDPTCYYNIYLLKISCQLQSTCLQLWNRALFGALLRVWVLGRQSTCSDRAQDFQKCCSGCVLRTTSVRTTGSVLSTVTPTSVRKCWSIGAGTPEISVHEYHFGWARHVRTNVEENRI